MNSIEAPSWDLEKGSTENFDSHSQNEREIENASVSQFWCIFQIDYSSIFLVIASFTESISEEGQFLNISEIEKTY